ncbi:MAG: hypothetical protein V4506_11985 [Bacteroidota bacterium]
MKKFFLVAVLVISASIAVAQDKYEFMTINYLTQRTITISIDGEIFLKEKVELSKEESTEFNTNPLLKKVKEYQDKGWEILNFNSYGQINGGINHIAYLRKKKTN